MLSALIPSEHSYPALQLVPKPAHQRFVHLGPLVTYSHITMCADYIFILHSEAAAYYGDIKISISLN